MGLLYYQGNPAFCVESSRHCSCGIEIYPPAAEPVGRLIGWKLEFDACSAILLANSGCMLGQEILKN
jgi:hypothetical protein